MILDKIEHSALYAPISPRIAKALAWLREADVKALPAGRHDIDGDAIYALVQDIVTKPAEEGVWEAHRRYLDIQSPVTGHERIGYAPLEALTVTRPYDEAGDYCLLSGDGVLQRLTPGMFAMLLPQDGHMPGIAADEPRAIRKVVVKVLV